MQDLELAKTEAIADAVEGDTPNLAALDADQVDADLHNTAAALANSLKQDAPGMEHNVQTDERTNARNYFATRNATIENGFFSECTDEDLNVLRFMNNVEQTLENLMLQHTPEEFAELGLPDIWGDAIQLAVENGLLHLRVLKLKWNDKTKVMAAKTVSTISVNSVLQLGTKTPFDTYGWDWSQLKLDRKAKLHMNAITLFISGRMTVVRTKKYCIADVITAATEQMPAPQRILHPLRSQSISDILTDMTQRKLTTRGRKEYVEYMNNKAAAADEVVAVEVA